METYKQSWPQKLIKIWSENKYSTLYKFKIDEVDEVPDGVIYYYYRFYFLSMFVNGVFFFSKIKKNIKSSGATLNKQQQKVIDE